MKITFIKKLPEKFNGHFAIYEYDEVLANHPGYIDVRGVVKNQSEKWLDEINESFSHLSSTFLGHTRWWWATGMSRLDARPWVQEHLFKSIFFAAAVLEWLVAQQDAKEIFLIGCPHEVAMYLREFKKDLVIEEDAQLMFSQFSIFSLLKHLFIAILKLFKNAIYIARHHLFQKESVVRSDTLVLYESVANVSLVGGHKYYYNGLLDELNTADNSFIAYGCIDSMFSPIKKLRLDLNDEIFFVMDSISFRGFVKSIFLNIYLILLTGWISLGNNSCRLGKYSSGHFWSKYLLSELSRVVFLNHICCYYALNNIFKQHKYKCVISTYEEKIVERTILFSCNEAEIPVIGYIPHPQHHLALALRDTHKPYSPKPKKYAVCGQKYIDYFQSWCNKDPNSITVWGSKKYPRQDFAIKEISQDDLKVLMLISHPNELRVFCSWLHADPRLVMGKKYFLRMYKAANCRRFSEESEIIKSQFNFIEEIDGDLKDNMNFCDLACFCATSAGLLAVDNGLISIHLGLDDFFEINPCFNDLDPMLSCGSAVEFADLLDEICSMNADPFSQLYCKQRNFVNQIFSPIQTENIRKEILEVHIN